MAYFGGSPVQDPKTGVVSGTQQMAGTVKASNNVAAPSL